MFKLLESYLSRGIAPVSREAIERDVAEENKAAGIAVATRYTRGNVAIQRGDMIFKEDLGPQGAAPPKKTP